MEELELVPVRVTEKGNQAVSGRELHQFLESKQKFADWIKNRIEKYGFEENKYFYKLYFDVYGNLLKINVPTKTNIENQGVTNVHRIDYVLSLSMAKELSMIENNDKGRQARKYFIECEEKVKQKSTEDSLLLAIMTSNSEEEKAVAVFNYRSNVVLPLKQRAEEAEKKVEHQVGVISNLTGNVKLQTQRQFLNEIIRMKGNSGGLISARWNMLYKFYENQKHINLSIRMKAYNQANNAKIKSRLDFVETVLNDLGTLYQVAVKTFESDFKSKLQKYLDAL
jgi:phage anti-repressor protein